MKGLVLFGSKSDANIYEPLLEKLKNIDNNEIEFYVLSAHRNPDELETVLKTSYFDYVIAGAGIAAHLPGVVASKTKKPVIGLPVGSYFSGLDAFASIVQMPYQVPVISFGPDKVDSIISFLKIVKNKSFKSDTVNLVIPPDIKNSSDYQKELKRTLNLADSLKIKVEQSNISSESLFNIITVNSDKDVNPKALGIHVPFMSQEEKDKPDNLIKIMEWANIGGAFVCTNNTRNALLSFQKLTNLNSINLPLLMNGSVKDIYGEKEKGPYIFSFSDRYSIFDWGEMPDSIDEKGKTLALTSWLFFNIFSEKETWKNLKLPTSLKDNTDIHKTLNELKEKGLSHHANGLVDNNMNIVAEKEATNLLSINPVKVLRPEFLNHSYNYEQYNSKPIDTLVPLEVIFRFSVPKGSSLLKRTGDSAYLKELGLDIEPKVGDNFEIPIIEFSTKLEPIDRYINKSEIVKISGLSESEIKRLKNITTLISLKMKDIFGEIGIELLDGKFEFAFTGNKDDRDFMLVDSIGPDELRLMYKGVQLSKQVLRNFYINSGWKKALDKSRDINRSFPEANVKSLCLNNFCQSPEKLEGEKIKLVSDMYKVITNQLSKHLLGEDLFINVSSLDEIANNLKDK